MVQSATPRASIICSHARWFTISNSQSATHAISNDVHGPLLDQPSSPAGPNPVALMLLALGGVSRPSLSPELSMLSPRPSCVFYLALLSCFGQHCRSADPIPPRRAHSPRRSDDTEAHTNTAQCPAGGGEARACTTVDEPVAASARRHLNRGWGRG